MAKITNVVNDSSSSIKDMILGFFALVALIGFLVFFIAFPAVGLAFSFIYFVVIFAIKE